MKLSAYLSASRHGVYYFRWPLPTVDSQNRRTLNISLRTKCPDHAGDLARYLASCGRLVRDNKTLAKLRQDQMREMVRSYFVKVLDGYTERLNNTGWEEHELDFLQQELEVHEDGIANFDDLSDQYLDAASVVGFRASANVTPDQWAENEPDLRREMRKGRRDLIKAFLSRSEGFEGYSLTDPINAPPIAPATRSATLGAAIEDFMAEHIPQWSNEMQKKARSYLAVPLEYFGTDRNLADISRQDAAELKKVVQALPANRSIKQETRGLILADAIAVPNMDKITSKTVNNYIDTFRRFWDWAERHGHAPAKLFEGMKVSKAKQTVDSRRAYTQNETHLIKTELINDASPLVKKADYKWGALLGLYTGARLREVAQLNVSDVRQEGSLWYIDFNDDDENKSLKTKASKRRVPVHSDLISLGFLDWVSAKPDNQRLFLSFSFNAKEGYGRNLGRWFNNVLLVGLDLKESGLVFHSLRHTMVTRLGQAGVPEPLYQEIVGHERQGVSQQVYFKEGHTLAQKQKAIEKFEV